jgi:hypothetical protein
MIMIDESMFSRTVTDLAVAAPGLPEGTLGWTRESAKRAIRSLVGKIVVSGVSVFDRVQWGFAPAPEFFQCFPLRNERATEFAIRSRTEAEKWIDGFPRSEVLFVLELSFQDEAAEGTGSI